MRLLWLLSVLVLATVVSAETTILSIEGIEGNRTVLPVGPHGSQYQLEIYPRWCKYHFEVDGQSLSLNPDHLSANHTYAITHEGCRGYIYLRPYNQNAHVVDVAFIFFMALVAIAALG